MKLLFDQNLSHRLVIELSDLYPNSLHVRDVGLKEADDQIVWEYAIQHEFTIVSKDADFHQQSFLRGHPPKVIWLRVGNCPTNVIVAMLRKHHPSILTFEQSESASFLILE